MQRHVMDGRKCFRCGLFWASNSGPDKNFDAITKMCPMCVPKAFPVQPWGLVRS